MLKKKNLRKNKFAVIVSIVILNSFLFACSDQNSTSRLTPDDYPESDSATAKLYLQKCGSCHAAPLPDIHTEKQWFGVVQRMQFRMTNKAIRPLNKQEVASIVAYLQKHARKD